MSAHERVGTTVSGDAHDSAMADDRVEWGGLMRRLSVALFCAALVGIGAPGCGERAGSGDRSRVPAKATYFKGDDDIASDDIPSGRGGDDDTAFLASHGELAQLADRRAITALVMRYYAVALTGDGAMGCSLLYPGLAASLATSQAQALKSSPPGRATCAAVLSSLFKYQHRRLTAELPTMGVIGVRVKGDSGLALLGFRAMPERQITVERQGGAWKLAALFDSEVA